MSHQNGLSLDSVVAMTTEQVSCDLAGEAAILDLHSGVYYGLNRTGAFIWDRIKTPITVRAVRDAMASEFDVDEARCERDLLSVLSDMVQRGLVEVKNEATR
jgi:hypothetical protein